MSGILYDPIDHGTPDSSPLLAGLRSGAWLDVQDFPPLCYAVPGIIPEGSVLLVGPPKIGKSWLVLTVALAASDGGKALGLDIPKRPTLYLALEDGDRRMQDRCRRLLHSQPIPRSFQYLTRVDHGRVLDTVAAWLDLQADPALVILDTLGKVMPPALNGESAYQRDYRVGSYLKQFADDHPGTTVLVNHHDRKADADDFVDSVSGTHGLAGAADTIVVLTRPRLQDDGLVKVTGRDVPEGEYAVRFQGGYHWASTATAWPPRPPPPSRRAPPLGSGTAPPTSSRPSPSSAWRPPPTSPTCSAWNRSASACTSPAWPTAAA